MTQYFIKSKVRKTNKGKTLLKKGDVFGTLTVIEDVIYGLKSCNHNFLKCKCSCGKESFRRTSELIKNNKIKCFDCCPSHKTKRYKEVGLISSQFLSDIKSNAKQRSLEFNLTMEELWELYQKQNGKCALSGIELILLPVFYSASIRANARISTTRREITASVDRIDSNIGYTIDNVQFVHKAINIMKGSLSDSDFINISKAIAKHNSDKQDDFEPSQLNGYLKRYIINIFRKSKLEGATHSD